MKHPSYTAKTDPDKIAYEMAGSGETLSFGQLDKRSNQAAHGFRKLQVEAGENIALLFENCLDFVVLTWAAQRSWSLNMVSPRRRQSQRN
ncbi:AMP-binding protein [Sulfitobacter pontiacus]|uniref:AMP-binding protein n=1 Tax=Sulfitobacter pontiacus TaxID=60137 RepID=UPI00277A852B|nr:AMP-binding protein [Sulfitobacter pontiacus]GLO79667.1 hypothetical protein MACH23_30880 [Sulfitobacter pontiacus]